MAVTCANCGEELLGAVNRCWNCGHEFVLGGAREPEVPPIRRSPIEPSLVAQHWCAPAIFAEIVVDDSEEPAQNDSSEVETPTHESSKETTTAESAPVGRIETELPQTGVAASQPVEVRRGSPFAEKESAPPRLTVSVRSSPSIRTQYPQNTASIGGAFAAVVLGVISLAGAFISAAGSLITSLVGIGLGLWGLHSKQRGFAVAGLVLCIIALTLASFFVAVFVFETIYGYNPLYDNPIDNTNPADW